MNTIYWKCTQEFKFIYNKYGSLRIKFGDYTISNSHTKDTDMVYKYTTDVDNINAKVPMFYICCCYDCDKYSQEQARDKLISTGLKICSSLLDFETNNYSYEFINDYLKGLVNNEL